MFWKTNRPFQFNTKILLQYNINTNTDYTEYSVYNIYQTIRCYIKFSSGIHYCHIIPLQKMVKVAI